MKKCIRWNGKKLDQRAESKKKKKNLIKGHKIHTTLEWSLRQSGLKHNKCHFEDSNAKHMKI